MQIVWKKQTNKRTKSEKTSIEWETINRMEERKKERESEKYKPLNTVNTTPCTIESYRMKWKNKYIAERVWLWQTNKETSEQERPERRRFCTTEYHMVECISIYNWWNIAPAWLGTARHGGECMSVFRVIWFLASSWILCHGIRIHTHWLAVVAISAAAALPFSIVLQNILFIYLFILWLTCSVVIVFISCVCSILVDFYFRHSAENC